MSEETKIEDIHLGNLIKKLRENLDKKVKEESNPANVLLKGHLMIEGVMQELISIFDAFQIKKPRASTGDVSADKLQEVLERFDILPRGRFNKIGFHQKIKVLNSIKMDGLEDEKARVVNCLYALNDSRNELAHNIESSVSENSVDNIGINIGSKFIMQKYQVGHDGVKDNLLFCLDNIVHQLGLLIYHRIIDLRKESQASQNPQTNSTAI